MTEFDIFNKTLDIYKEFSRLKTIIRFQKIGLKDKSRWIKELEQENERLKKIIDSDNMFKNLVGKNG